MQIRLWDLDSGECLATFSGHRKQVSALRFSRNGALLASGSKDTDIVVWDVAGEAGLYRLRGHRDQVRAGRSTGMCGRGAAECAALIAHGRRQRQLQPAYLCELCPVPPCPWPDGMPD